MLQITNHWRYAEINLQDPYTGFTFTQYYNIPLLPCHKSLKYAYTYFSITSTFGAPPHSAHSDFF